MPHPDYVQYHNTDKLGRRPQYRPGRTGIFWEGNKSVPRGARVWLVAGETLGNRKRYFLCNWFIVESVDTKEASGTVFQRLDPPVEIGHASWFPEFLHYMGNFGRGLSPLRSKDVVNFEKATGSTRAATTTQSAIEDELTQALLASYKRAGRETGYWGNYFLRALKKDGGQATVRRMLSKGGVRGKTKGFYALVDAGRPDLSVEAVALSPRFRRLFTNEELSTARGRLAQFPRYAQRKRIPPDEVFPEILPKGTYIEGAAKRVTVNVYERDTKARAACIKRHGASCAVCRLNFGERYGPIGRGFIHVHHKKPVAARRGSYRLDPSKDLVPVCPNCHAMLHTSYPPLSVPELQEILAARVD